MTDGGIEAGASPMVCACFSVSLDSVCAAIRSGKASSVGDLGKLNGAGSNCGSCLPELKRIVAREKRATAAA